MNGHFLHELQAAFAERGEQPALCHGGRTYSHRQLGELAQGCAAWLQSLGVQPGERVVLYTPARLPFLVGHLGTLFAGAVSLPLNPRCTREEMRFFLSDSSARVVIAGAEQRALVDALRPDLPGLATVVPDDSPRLRLALEESFSKHSTPVQNTDPCLLIYSSGTTGWPKGVVHTHANLACALRALQDCWRISADDVVVNVLPLFHVHGLCFATLLPLLAGGCVLLQDAFDPVGTLEAIGQGTVFMAVPTIYYKFLGEPKFREAASRWSKVRLFTCGSAPIRPEVLPELEAILGRPVINRYGMSEAHVITSLPLEGPWPPGSVGKPLAGIELRVARDDGSQAAAGEVGTVLIRGPNLFAEYWGQPEATRAAFAGGWFDTGDCGYLDDAGFLTLVGRKNDLIITSGYNVYPQVVERAINECPGVCESAVVGLADATRGECVAAVVVRDDPRLTEERLRQFLGDRLIAYQRPALIRFVDALPRNALGKVLRRQLRKTLEA